MWICTKHFYPNTELVPRLNKHDDVIEPPKYRAGCGPAPSRKWRLRSDDCGQASSRSWRSSPKFDSSGEVAAHATADTPPSNEEPCALAMTIQLRREDTGKKCYICGLTYHDRIQLGWDAVVFVVQLFLVYCVLFVVKIYRIQLMMSVKCVQSVASALNLSHDIIHLKADHWFKRLTRWREYA